jgi:hypothetical protein
LRADRIRFVHSARFGLSKSCEGGHVRPDRTASGNGANRARHCIVSDGWGEACGGAGKSSMTVARETIDILIFVKVVDLLLSALCFHVKWRGLLQVYDVTDHKQIGQEQESDDDVLHSASMARKR